MLALTDVDISYGRIAAVRKLSLEVSAGEIVALIGTNGAGKSSTLKAIFGLLRPSAGRIAFEEKSLVGLRPEQIVREGLALVPEGRHIFQRLTVAENLSLGRASGRKAPSDSLDRLLDRFPVLRRFYRKSAAGLSGGEQQQLAIARALLSHPRFLLLDEPSLGLAPLMVKEVFDALADLRSDGVTVLLVEQNATQAVALADRTYVLQTGTLVLSGTREQMLARGNLADTYLGAEAQ